MNKKENINNKGITLVELMVAVAILGIIASMVTPIMNSVSKANRKLNLQIELDNSLGKSIEIIKRTVRRSSGVDGIKVLGGTEGIKVYATATDTTPLAPGTPGKKVEIRVPVSSKTDLDYIADDIEISLRPYSPAKTQWGFDDTTKEIKKKSINQLVIRIRRVMKSSGPESYSAPDVLAENIGDDISFRYQEDIFVVFLRALVGTSPNPDNIIERKIRDSAVTRMRIN